MIDVQSIKPPSVPEAEDALCSTLLASPDRVAPILIQARIQPSDFTKADVAAVITEVLSLWASRQHVDPIQIGIKLKDVINIHRMTELISMMAVPSAAQGYWDMVKDASNRRKIVQGCLTAAYEASVDGLSEAMASMNDAMASVNNQLTVQKPSSIKDLLRESISALSEPNKVNTVPTGIVSLDRISQVRQGDFVVIAAQAKGGKSTLALSYAAAVAARNDNVMICSLEMPARDISEKLLARQSRVSLPKLYHRSFNDNDLQRIRSAIETMSKWSLEIRDDCHDLGQILTAARLAHAKKPLKMLIVDYLQLVQSPRKNGDSREREVAEVSRQLRLLSLDLGCVVVALSQLNDDGRLRESRAIGQDATAVWSIGDGSSDGMKTVFIPAQRNGESGVACELVFKGEYSTFEEGGD